MSWGEFGLVLLGGLLGGAGIAALALVLDVMFPKLVRRGRTVAAQMPFRSALVGMVNLGFFSIVSVALLSIAQSAEDAAGSDGGAGLLRLIAAVLLLALLTLIALGITAIARWLGERIVPEASSVRSILTGIITLEVAALAPFIGWVLVPLVTTLVGCGAVIIALVWRREG